MSSSDRERWQRTHRDHATRGAPSPFVAEHVARLASGRRGARALDIACGNGRHAALLVAHGYQTVAVDYSFVACARVVQDLNAAAVVGDALALPFRDSSFAVVVQTLFLERAIVGRLLALLAPGGVLLAETFLRAQHEETGHPRLEFCLAPGELRELCVQSGVGVRVLDSREGIVANAKGASHLAAIAVCKV